MARQGRERRGAPRQRRRLRVRFWNDSLETSGFTTDVSASGLFIESSTVAPPGTRLHLEMTLESGPFFAECVVARVLRAARNVQPVVKGGIGVRFVGLDEALAGLGSKPDDGLRLDLRDPEKLATVYVRDIKRGGLFVPTRQPPAQDSTVTVRLEVPEPHEAIEARGRVIHLTEDPPGAGLELLDLEELRAKLASIITG